MNLDAIVKYVGSALLLGSLFFLVLTGKMDAGQYEATVMGVLTALGVYHAAAAGKGDKP